MSEEHRLGTSKPRNPVSFNKNKTVDNDNGFSLESYDKKQLDKLMGIIDEYPELLDLMARYENVDMSSFINGIRKTMQDRADIKQVVEQESVQDESEAIMDKNQFEDVVDSESVKGEAAKTDDEKVGESSDNVPEDKPEAVKKEPSIMSKKMSEYFKTDNGKKTAEILNSVPETNDKERIAKAVLLANIFHTGKPGNTYNLDTLYNLIAAYHDSIGDGDAWRNVDANKSLPKKGWGNPNLGENKDHLRTLTTDISSFDFSTEEFSVLSKARDDMSKDMSKKYKFPLGYREKLLPAIVEEPAYEKVDSTTYTGKHDNRIGGKAVQSDDGLIHYEGTLGKFEFNPNEFELQCVHAPADAYGNPATTYPILKYIGDEVDGNRIKIPEGLTDMTCMFEGNANLQTMPEIPDTVEDGCCAFKDCTNLVAARPFSLTSKMKRASFMFSGCENMEHGPSMLPPRMKDATGMFVDCRSMTNTPVIVPGMECMDSTFANCESLTKKPVLPHTVKYADYATEGCTGIDNAEKKALADKNEKARAKFEKSLDKKGFTGHIGSVFSAAMQVHALHKSGYNMMMAVLVTNSLRKDGIFRNDMAGGFQALSRASKGATISTMLYHAARRQADDRAQRNAENKAQRLKEFDATSTKYKSASKNDMKMYRDGYNSATGKYFVKVTTDGYPAIGPNREAARMDADSFREAAMSDSLSVNTKTAYAKKAVAVINQQMAYYAGSIDGIEEAVKSGEMSKSDKNLSYEGLLNVTQENTMDLLNGISQLQQAHHFMNQRQVTAMYESLDKIDCIKSSDAYKDFKKTMDASVKETAVRENNHRTAQMNSHQRVDYQTKHGERVAAAENIYSTVVDDEAEQSSPEMG